MLSRTLVGSFRNTKFLSSFNNPKNFDKDDEFYDHNIFTNCALKRSWQYLFSRDIEREYTFNLNHSTDLTIGLKLYNIPLNPIKRFVLLGKFKRYMAKSIANTSQHSKNNSYIEHMDEFINDLVHTNSNLTNLQEKYKIKYKKLYTLYNYINWFDIVTFIYSPFLLSIIQFSYRWLVWIIKDCQEL